MAAYTNEDIKRELGRKYNETSSYTLETHRGAYAKITAEPDKFKAVGKILDFTTTETGTMIIVEHKG